MGDGAAAPQREDDGTQLAERFDRVTLNDEIDEKLGFARVQDGVRRDGWLVNMHPVSIHHTCFHRRILILLPPVRRC